MVLNSLRFDSYTTGIYGQHKTGGVTLQFICEATGDNYYVIFNADLKRKRSTKQHKVGTPLPSGRFAVGRRSLFYKFWVSTSLPIHSRLSAFNDRMGKLKGFVFTANISKGKRLDAKSLRPLLNDQLSVMPLVNKVQTNVKQFSNNEQTRIANNDSMLAPANAKSNENQTTCLNNYGISKQGTTDTRTSISPITTAKQVREQTNQEWLDDCQNYF
jgi:hypothetical protein